MPDPGSPRPASGSADDQTWTTWPIPAPLVPLDALAMADGRILLRWLGGEERYGFAWLDPATGEWTVGRRPCDEPDTGLHGGLVGVGGARAVGRLARDRRAGSTS